MPWLGVLKSLWGPDNAATMERASFRRPGPQVVKLREMVENVVGVQPEEARKPGGGRVDDGTSAVIVPILA